MHAWARASPDQMHAERVDGCNPLAVIDGVRRKKKLLLEGKGPVLLDVVTYRCPATPPRTSPPTAPRKRSPLGAQSIR